MRKSLPSAFDRVAAELVQTLSEPLVSAPVVSPVRVRILIGFSAGEGPSIRRGDAMTVPASVAERWFADGLAIKAPLDGPVEASIAKLGWHQAQLRGFDPDAIPNFALATPVVGGLYA